MSTLPLTVALVSTQKGFRGGESQARLLMVGLRERGQRCVIYARSGGAFARQMAGDGFDVVDFPSRGRSPWAMWTIRRHLKRHRPDVLVCNDSHALTAAGLASLGLPIGLRVGARRLAFPLRSVWKYQRLCDIVLTSSKAGVEPFVIAGLSPARIRMIYDGVVPGRPSSSDRRQIRRSLAIDDDQKLLLVVAALETEKGHSVLLQALPAVVAKHPNIVVALAGEGSLKDALTREEVELGLTKHVHFLGQRADVSDLLLAADLLVSPSLSESLGNSVIESLYARVPVVTTTAGGLAEVVGLDEPDGPVAFTAPPDDEIGLADALIHALDSREQYESLAQRGRQRMERMFNPDRMVDQWLAMFRELLNIRQIRHAAA